MILKPKTLFSWSFLCLLLFFQTVNAQVRLPRLISDGMTLQRDTAVNIWGWAATGEKIVIDFVGKTYNTSADKKFLWAKAKITGNKVIVWHDDIAEPVAVRYAWADNPEGANLYNREGLPASPFRTD